MMPAAREPSHGSRSGSRPMPVPSGSRPVPVPSGSRPVPVPVPVPVPEPAPRKRACACTPVGAAACLPCSLPPVWPAGSLSLACSLTGTS
eukprot:scaffold3500_cov56-Phaeocystis_antarctica.AAC.1